jgi:hypothetical protein
LRTEVGRDPHNHDLTDLIDELSTDSEEFRTLWATHDVRLHRTGSKTWTLAATIGLSCTLGVALPVAERTAVDEVESVGRAEEFQCRTLRPRLARWYAPALAHAPRGRSRSRRPRGGHARFLMD